MKKAWLIFALAGTISVPANAQNNSKEAEAKVAYLLAEDEFGAGNYESCITYLADASKKLGSANSKILYLKIMAEREMTQQDKSYTPKVLNTIAAFEKAPDVKSFNQEKYLEVLKLKLLIEKEAKQAEKDRQELAAKEKEQLERFQEFSRKGWVLGSTLDQARKEQPAFFANAEKTSHAEGDVYQQKFDVTAPWKNGVKMVYVKNNIVYGISDDLFYYDEDENYSKSTNSIKNKVVASLNEQFGFPPIEKTTDESTKNKKAVTTYYTWEKDGKTVAVTLSHFSFSKKDRIGLGSMMITDKKLAK